MYKCAIGDRVIITKANIEAINPFEGETGTVIGVQGITFPYLVLVDRTGTLVWCEAKGCEEDKMFTKNDLKNGMFGVMDNGWYFVIVDDVVVYENGNHDIIATMNDAMEFTFKRVNKVWTNCNGFGMAHFANDFPNESSSELVYERKNKSLYNGKVVCIDNEKNPTLHTVGKIYQFVDGKMTADNGLKYPTFRKIYSLEDWINFSGSKFIEVKE